MANETPSEEFSAACPICEAPAGETIRLYTSKEAAQAFVPSNIALHRHEQTVKKLTSIWGDGSCRIVKCDHCHFAFSVPFTAGDAEFYELISPETNYPRWKWEFHRTIQTLRSFDAPALDVIEIGAGNGAFLRMLHEAGYSTDRLFATEFSSVGRAAIEKQGIMCADCDVRSLGPERKFDVVCMFQVLEHLDDYQGLFEALHRLTYPGSHLFLAVPYGEWISRNECHGLLL